MTYRYLIINSENRVSGTPSDFDINLVPHIETNAIKLMHCNIPNVIYNITTKNNSLTYTENVTDYTVTITPGSYNKSELFTAIDAAMVSGANTYTTTYNSITQRTTITRATGAITFTIQSETEKRKSNSLATLLGFIETGSLGTSQTSTRALNLNNPGFVKIVIGEFSHNVRTEYANISCTFVVPNDVNKSEIINWTETSGFNQVRFHNETLNRLTVKLFDEHDNKIDLSCDWYMIIRMGF